MNDYEKLCEALDRVINELQELAVPDEDLDEMVYTATSKLQYASDKASERS